MDPHRVEPTIYEAFMARLAEHSLSPLCGNAWRILAGVDLSHPVFRVREISSAASRRRSSNAGRAVTTGSSRE